VTERLAAVSFTAARDLDDAGREVVLNVLVQVPRAGRYVTGAARGGDAFIGARLVAGRPDAEHVVIVPADRSQLTSRCRRPLTGQGQRMPGPHPVRAYAPPWGHISLPDTASR
jgi:hypothetical protein